MSADIILCLLNDRVKWKAIERRSANPAVSGKVSFNDDDFVWLFTGLIFLFVVSAYFLTLPGTGDITCWLYDKHESQ